LKKNRLIDIDFYLVTDSDLSAKGTIHDVKQALRAGCRIVQYREKNKSIKEMITEAVRIKELCEDSAIFLVNDVVDVALAVNADGVHIGQDDMPYNEARALLGEEKIIGVTVHDAVEAVEAEIKGADYIGLSPIFKTSTKKDAGMACGIPMISEVRKQVTIPIVAIGGIDKNNISEVITAGADAAVAISAVVGASDVYNETLDFITIIREAKRAGERL